MKLQSLPLLVLSWYQQNLHYRIIKLSKVSTATRIQYGRCILSISLKPSCTLRAESNRCIAMNVHNSGGCGFSSAGISHQQTQDSDGFWGAWKLVALVLVPVMGHNSMYLLPEEEQCKALVYVFRCSRIPLTAYNSKESAPSNSRVYVRLNDPWARLSLRAGPHIIQTTINLLQQATNLSRRRTYNTYPG